MDASICRQRGGGGRGKKGPAHDSASHKLSKEAGVIRLICSLPSYKFKMGGDTSTRALLPIVGGGFVAGGDTCMCVVDVLGAR